MSRARSVALALAGALSACSPDIDPDYLINSMRVLAMVAEPPEVVVGQASTVTAIVAAPDLVGAAPSVALSVCVEHDPSQAEADCPDPVPLAGGAPVALATRVFAVTTSMVPDAATVAGVPPTTMAAGFWVPLRAAASAEGVPTVRAIKRLVVSDGSAPPNANPILRKVDIWSGDTLCAAPHVVRRDPPMTLVPDYDPTAFTSYTVLAADGTQAARLEAPQITWYVTVGSLSAAVTRGERSVVWSLPDDAALWNTTQQLVAVLRDGRGGTAAWATDVAVRP